MWFFNRNRSTEPIDPIDRYKKYRTIGTQLTQKVMDSPCGSETLMEKAGRTLGIVQGKTLLLEQQDEAIALTDFLFFDYRQEGQTLTERYTAEIGGSNSDEQLILKAWQSAYTSLFKVTQVSTSEPVITLSDLLNPGASIELMDLSFSKTAIPGLLFFTRIVPFDEFNTTSGCTFVFPETREKHLMTKYKSLVKKVKTTDERIQRFVCFFKLNRTYGMEVSYR